MTAPRAELTAGVFWRAVSDTSHRALQQGALQPISTTPHYVSDRGVEFVVRVSDNLARKQSAPSTYRESRGPNPFLPPHPALTVGEPAPDHVAVLNKFNVLPDHVLVITRDFVHQESPLTPADFEAAAPGLVGGAGLAFYNGGRIAGASQAHRHFQLVPLPLGRGPGLPTATLFEAAADGLDGIAALPFRHWLTRPAAAPSDAGAFGRACHEAYGTALHDLDIEPERVEGEPRLPPYNLLLTDRWLFVVPRSTEHFQEVSVNGLGYAGSLFVSTPARLEQVRAAGPMAVLAAVSKPRH